MSTFLFLVVCMVVGALLWQLNNYPRVATAGSWIFGIALAAILWGMHPSVPGLVGR